VIDPFGNIPILLSILKDTENRRMRLIISREMLIGLLLLVLFLYFGNIFLKLFHLETGSITISGGIIFFIISLRMIFPGIKGSNLYASDRDPFIVPIAMPMIAGPAALATLLVMGESSKGGKIELLISLFIAWAVSFIILLLSPSLIRVLKERGLTAMERLMGMLLLMMSVQKFIDGLREIIPNF
jgi:multiple antibiotic resistance protein